VKSSNGVKRVRPLLGAYVEIELRGDAEEGFLNAVISEGFEAISEIDRLMSCHRSDSDLTCLNRTRPGTWVEVHPLTGEVLKASQELFLASRGAFDIRCGASLVDWGILPGPAGGRRFRSAPGNTAPLDFSGTRVRKTGPWFLDLGGIAKGYAVDRAVERIRRLTSRRLTGRVNAGGDLRVWGRDAVPVALRVEGEEAAWIRPFEMRRSAAATSSVRTRVAGPGGFPVSDHVKMPEGSPLRTAGTVTVFADQCLFADALTKVVLMGSSEIAADCLSSYQAGALVFEPDGHLRKAMGF
jgi:thiamine biosynthesis lipoprotein